MKEKPDIDRTQRWLCVLLAGAIMAAVGLRFIGARQHKPPPPVVAPPITQAEGPATSPGNRPAPPRYAVEPLDAGNVPLTPRAINDRGQIVGYIESYRGYRRAFLWQMGKLTLLRTLGGRYSGANAV